MFEADIHQCFQSGNIPKTGGGQIYLIFDRELLMAFQDVTLLPSGASFSATFPKNYGRCESLVTTTCLETVVGVSKGMFPVIYFCSNKASFVSVKFCGDHKTYMVEVNVAILGFMDIA